MSETTDQVRPGNRRPGEHHLIAVYGDAEQAREAVVGLERKGVEGGNIEVVSPGPAGAGAPKTDTQQLDADMEMSGDLAKRSLAGIVLGSVVGALAVALAAVLADAAFDLPGPTAGLALAGATGGAAFGAFAGGFYGGASGLPVSDAWSETFHGLEEGRTAVVVHSAELDQVDRADAALRDTGALRMARFGPEESVRPDS